MIDDLQKASILKRVSAWLFDFICLCVIVVGAAALLSLVLGYNDKQAELEGYYQKYGEMYGVEYDISSSDFAALTPQEQKPYNDMIDALNKDNSAVGCYNMIISMTLLIASMSILIGYLIIEGVVPLLLKHGRTLGKRIFGLGVMHIDGVRLTNVQLFTRTILGKFTIETMVPALIIIMISFNSIGMVGMIVLLGIIILQLGCLIVTRTNSAIHDRISNTVVVDMATQLIFDTEEDLLEFQKERARSQAENRSYF